MDTSHAYVCAYASAWFACVSIDPCGRARANVHTCTHRNNPAPDAFLVDFAGRTPLPDVLHHDLDQPSPLLEEFMSKIELLKAVAAHPLGW